MRWKLKEYLVHSDPGSHQLRQKVDMYSNT